MESETLQCDCTIAANDNMHTDGQVPSSEAIDRCFEAGLEAALADPRGVGPRDLGINGDLPELLGGSLGGSCSE